MPTCSRSHLFPQHTVIGMTIARDRYPALPLLGTWPGFPHSFPGWAIDVDIATTDSAGVRP